MSESTKLFQGKLASGINVELHSATSFSGREEVALLLNGEQVAISSVEVKKSGSIEYRPIVNVKKIIKGINPNQPESEQATQRPASEA